jgi:dihydroorotate dehydrogenase (NAD+) catalytic subunit
VRLGRRPPPRFDVDLRTTVGSVELSNPVMTASGTAGHGAELAAYFDLSLLGAVVVKSVSAGPFAGNPSPRLRPVPGGMLNSVGLQGPGIDCWLERDLPPLLATGASVVASIWGGRVEDFAAAASLLSRAPAKVVGVEVNVSCPNLDDRRRMFAHSANATAEAVAASAGCGRPLWAKLSPNVPDLVEIGAAALGAGAEGLVLVNTLLGLAVDLERRRPALGGAGGGLSGPGLHSVAVRAVYECREAFPGAGIVGVGGVSSGEDAIELVLAGADAVEVGTATLVDPRSSLRVLEEMTAWLGHHRVATVRELVGAAHG